VSYELPFAVKCEYCKNTTRDPSRRCHLHRDINSSTVQRLTFGTVAAPKQTHSSALGVNNADYDDAIPLAASTVYDDFQNGVAFELDITDGYGTEFERIASVEPAGRPNEGMLAMTTTSGITIYYAPSEIVDVKVVEDFDRAVAV
jgi:hypothetical protein